MSATKPAAPPMPLGSSLDEPAFANPWQARAFALAVALNEAGHLDWPGWTRLLGEEIAKEGLSAPDPKTDGEAYYQCWIAALERAVVATAGNGAR